MIDDENRADFILAINTNANGLTYEANTPTNDGKADNTTRYFADMIQDYVTADKNVVVADISYANGSDNALMEVLNGRGLLFNLLAYGGWNTATNSTGFALSTGMLARKMTAENKRSLLLTRYLDDWVYQANIRNIMLSWQRGSGYYDALNDKRDNAAAECENMITNFVRSNLPNAHVGENLRVEFPWNRMFEARIYFDK